MSSIFSQVVHSNQGRGDKALFPGQLNSVMDGKKKKSVMQLT